jgi:hypothetical protein
MKKFCITTISIAVILLCFCFTVNAQINGYVFRDYNGNGVIDTTTTYYEKGISNVIVKAYDTADVQIGGTKITDTTGKYRFTILELPAGKLVRLEFTIPNTPTNCLNKQIDFTGYVGSGVLSNLSSVQFVTSGSGNINYAINNPEEHNTNINPTLYVPYFRNGDPTVTPPGAPTISPNDSSTFLSFAYNAAGTVQANTVLSTAKKIGATWGTAYSKQSGIIFTSATLKRHTGMGPANGNYINAPGTIYTIKPGSDVGTFFTSIDSSLFGLNYYSHDHTVGAALNVLKNGSAVGTRRMTCDVYSKVNDTAAFQQIGKVGIGGLEISQNGRYLYLVNIYNNELQRIDLQNPSAPVKPTNSSLLSRWALPALSVTDATKGFQRAWGLKWHRGKLYVGTVLDASISNLPADLKIFVYEFDPVSNIFNTVLSSGLNYLRSSPFVTGTCNTRSGWYAWTRNFNTCNFVSPRDRTNVYPQPMLTDIDFDRDGTMILSLSDRNGYQGGVGQYGLTGTNVYDSYVNGDILRAYRKNDCTFEMEFAAKEGSTSPKPATAGLGNSQGLGLGEFYVGDGDTDNPLLGFDFHPDCANGSTVNLPGNNHVLTTFVDPINGGTNGTAKLNNITGLLLPANSYEVYNTTNNVGTHHKIHGMGEIEFLKQDAPIEIGNRVWHDLDYDGIQEAKEPGVAGVQFTLYTDPNADGNPSDGVSIGVVTTDVNGNYIFSSATGANVTGKTYGLNILPNSNYIIRITNSSITVQDKFSTNYLGDPYGTFCTKHNQIGNGEMDWSDDDGEIFYLFPAPAAEYQIRIITGVSGENNHTYDIGMVRGFVVLYSNSLISLSAKFINQNALLNWNLKDKDAVKEYSIERSFDGKKFEQIHLETNANVLFLTENISSLNAKNLYYRIKLIEKDGRFLYSNIVAIQKQQFFTAKIIENPINDQLRILVENSSTENVIFQLFDASGKLVLQEHKLCIAGKNELAIKLNNFNKGVYVLKSLFNNSVIINKVVKQ